MYGFGEVAGAKLSPCVGSNNAASGTWRRWLLSAGKLFAFTEELIYSESLLKPSSYR